MCTFFRIITLFWKGLFISKSFKTRVISFNGTSEKRECVCFMSCPCESCPYKHKVYINFDYHSVRIEQLEVHPHPIDDLFKSTRLDYIRGYVEYFIKLVDSPTATTIGRLIKSSMSTSPTDDPEIISKFLLNNFSSSKLRREIRLALTGKCKRNSEKSCEDDIAVA